MEEKNWGTERTKLCVAIFPLFLHLSSFPFFSFQFSVFRFQVPFFIFHFHFILLFHTVAPRYNESQEFRFFRSL